MTIAGLILAAGNSTRMGRSKAFLPHPPSGGTFLEHLVHTARSAGISRTYVVARVGDTALHEAVISLEAEVVLNPRAAEGQLSSLIAGLDAAERRGVDAVIVWPVDLPQASVSAVRALIEAAEASPATIVRAAYGGQHGHPVIFKKQVWQELRTADPSVGARAVVRADPHRVVDVELGDPGVLEDVDTPQDFERLFGRQLVVGK